MIGSDEAFVEVEEALKIFKEEDFCETFEMQLSEIEMLKAMFANPGEFSMNSFGVIADMNAFIATTTSDRYKLLPTSNLDFQININVENIPIEINVNLPHEYPYCEPDVYVRSDKLSRIQQSNLNQELSQYITSLAKGEIYVGNIVFWLQENASNYYSENESTEEKSKTENDCKDEFSRYWIYSHHIYSKVKRREMLSLGEEFSMTGFIMPGKPGIICIEGNERDCSDWWQRVRSMTWKKILCRKKETFTNVTNINSLRKFPTFEEIVLQPENATSVSHHMDMGKFYKYLQEHDCAFAFKEYFGFDGKS